MKRLLKVVGISVSFLLGSLLFANASMSSQVTSASIPTKTVYVGETVGFNLTVMFGNRADPKILWAIAPDGTELKLTNTAMLVISNVQLSDAGFYRFYARNKDGLFEYCVALIVIAPEPNYEFALVDSEFFEELMYPNVLFSALKPDDEMYLG